MVDFYLLLFSDGNDAFGELHAFNNGFGDVGGL